MAGVVLLVSFQEWCEFGFHGWGWGVRCVYAGPAEYVALCAKAHTAKIVLLPGVLPVNSFWGHLVATMSKFDVIFENS